MADPTSSAVEDILGTSATKAPKKSAAKKAATKPGKPVVIKTPAPTTGKKAATAVPAKSGKKAPVAAKTPKAVKPAADVSTTQPEDKVVLAAVKKLKAPTLAAELASGLGVHRRVIRAQLIRMAKDKANGVVMKKDGFNWYVSSKA